MTLSTKFFLPYACTSGVFLSQIQNYFHNYAIESIIVAKKIKKLAENPDTPDIFKLIIDECDDIFLNAGILLEKSSTLIQNLNPTHLLAHYEEVLKAYTDLNTSIDALITTFKTKYFINDLTDSAPTQALVNLFQKDILTVISMFSLLLEFLLIQSETKIEWRENKHQFDHTILSLNVMIDATSVSDASFDVISIINVQINLHVTLRNNWFVVKNSINDSQFLHLVTDNLEKIETNLYGLLASKSTLDQFVLDSLNNYFDSSNDVTTP